MQTLFSNPATLLLTLVFVAVVLMSYMSYKKGADKGAHFFVGSIVLFAVISLFVMHEQDKQARESIVKRFEANQTVYCYQNPFDNKWVKPNKSDGWYLVDGVFKNKQEGVKISIDNCQERF
jgi:hypothetical protein